MMLCTFCTFRDIFVSVFVFVDSVVGEEGDALSVHATCHNDGKTQLLKKRRLLFKQLPSHYLCLEGSSLESSSNCEEELWTC